MTFGPDRFGDAVDNGGQEPQSGFPMVTARGAKLIKDAPLVRAPGALIAPVDAGQRLPFGR